MPSVNDFPAVYVINVPADVRAESVGDYVTIKTREIFDKLGTKNFVPGSARLQHLGGQLFGLFYRLLSPPVILESNIKYYDNEGTVPSQKRVVKTQEKV